MKYAARLISRFVLSLILFALVLGALVVLSRYVSGFDPQRASGGEVIAHMVAAIRSVFVLSVALSATVAIFATIRHTDKPAVPLVLLGAVWTALLLLGSLLWSANGNQGVTMLMHLPQGRIVQLENASIYSPSVNDLTASPIVVFDRDADPGFELFDRAQVEPSTGAVVIMDRPDIDLDLRTQTGAYTSMVAPPERLQPLLRDIRGLNLLFFGAANSPGSADPMADAGRIHILFVIAFGVFLLSCWTPARLTRWPLFNAVLVYGVLRGAIWTVNSIHFGRLRELVTTVVGPEQLGLVSAGILGFVAVVFVVALLLMQPLTSWKREVGDV